MHKPIKTSLFAIALLASAVAGANDSAKQSSNKGISDDTVKIGVLADMSGIFSDLSGEGAVTAARMAVDDFVAEQKP
ncbi:MAG TPA: ABC transporter permease, partial [Alcanivorax sp.]|nr:ABC transporter permease [Alcanivorax sp.]